MGSVHDDYKCPLCGRIGNGGYALDGINFPICTEGNYSCLWYQFMENRVRAPKEVIGRGLGIVLRPKRPQLHPEMLEAIVMYAYNVD